MRSIKVMLTGIFLVVLAAFCAACDGGQGSFLGAAAILLAPVGIIVFLFGIFVTDP